MNLPLPTLCRRVESGHSLALLAWRFPEPVTAIASGPLGGGLGPRRWVINATVDKAYARLDPDAHLGDLAGGLDLRGAGVGMLTAVDVADATGAVDADVSVVATVGVGHPTWAAAPDGDLRGPDRVGTINIVVLLPVRLSDAALVNAVATATEAKTQALWEYGVEATGTATDALFVGCCVSRGSTSESYGGPRSVWGSRLARAVYEAVGAGTRQWQERSAGRRSSRP